VIDLATRNAVNDETQQRTALLIGGGIANFTDVAQTFKVCHTYQPPHALARLSLINHKLPLHPQGIVHALKEYRERILRAKMQLFVRRAGPNYQSGLRLIQNVCNDLGIEVQVFGPEKNMTEIIPLAIAYIEGKN
jgi:ATP citrate (pro-S)-lyase